MGRGLRRAALAFLAAAVCGATSRAATLSYLLPGSGGCEWRLLDTATLLERTAARFDLCPRELRWLGEMSIAHAENAVWVGSWASAELDRVPPPPPLPHRGRVERVGFDGKKRPVAVVSEPLPEALDALHFPGPRPKATHQVTAYIYEGAWRRLLKDKVVLGPDGAPGLGPLERRIRWKGKSVSGVLATMVPYEGMPQLVRRGKRVFVHAPQGVKYVVAAEDAKALIKLGLLGANPRKGEYYGALPVDPPYRYAVAKTAPGRPPSYLLPVFGTNVEKGWGLRLLDETLRGPTQRIAMEYLDGMLLIVDAATGSGPKLFRGSDLTLAFESPQGTAACFFP